MCPISTFKSVVWSARKFIVNADKAKAKKLSWQTHRNKALFASIPIIIWGKNKKNILRPLSILRRSKLECLSPSVTFILV